MSIIGLLLLSVLIVFGVYVYSRIMQSCLVAEACSNSASSRHNERAMQTKQLPSKVAWMLCCFCGNMAWNRGSLELLINNRLLSKQMCSERYGFVSSQSLLLPLLLCILTCRAAGPERKCIGRSRFLGVTRSRFTRSCFFFVRHETNVGIPGLPKKRTSPTLHLAVIGLYLTRYDNRVNDRTGLYPMWFNHAVNESLRGLTTVTTTGHLRSGSDKMQEENLERLKTTDRCLKQSPSCTYAFRSTPIKASSVLYLGRPKRDVKRKLFGLALAASGHDFM